MKWKFNLDDSTKSRYGIVVVRDIFMYLVIGIKVSKHTFVVGVGPQKLRKTTTVDTYHCNFKP